MASNDRFGMQIMTAVLRVLEIMFGVVFFHIPIGVMDRDRGMEGASLLAIRWRTRRSRADLWQKSGSTESVRHIFSPLTPFFCVVNMSVTKVAA